jgi:hypothetical protein
MCIAPRRQDRKDLVLAFELGVLSGSTVLTTLSLSKGAFAARPVE